MRQGRGYLSGSFVGCKGGGGGGNRSGVRFSWGGGGIKLQ